MRGQLDFPTRDELRPDLVVSQSMSQNWQGPFYGWDKDKPLHLVVSTKSSHPWQACQLWDENFHLQNVFILQIRISHPRTAGSSQTMVLQVDQHCVAMMAVYVGL